MSQSDSPYYPPRSRWYSPFLYLGDSLRRRLALDRLRLPEGVSIGKFLLSGVVPGAGFYFRWRHMWGPVALVAAAVLLLTFILGIGTLVGNAAFGLLLSLHVTGLICLLEPVLARERFAIRILFSLAVMIMLAAVIYMPARNAIQQHWLMPLRVKDRVVVVHAGTRPAAVKTGDWIAFSVPAYSEAGVVIRAGYGCGPVLARGGDRIRFTATACEVNGLAGYPLPGQPASGEYTVPQKCWFVWPEFTMTRRGNAVGPSVAALLQLATVSEDQLIGTPFKRWLWRRQTAS